MKPTEYKDMIQHFLDGCFQSAEVFARAYDKIFLSEPGGMPDELFYILQDFWEDVDSYSPLWDPEDIDDAHITEETLREEAFDAVAKLEKYIKEHPEQDRSEL